MSRGWRVLIVVTALLSSATMYLGVKSLTEVHNQADRLSHQQRQTDKAAMKAKRAATQAKQGIEENRRTLCSVGRLVADQPALPFPNETLEGFEKRIRDYDKFLEDLRRIDCGREGGANFVVATASGDTSTPAPDITLVTPFPDAVSLSQGPVTPPVQTTTPGPTGPQGEEGPRGPTGPQGEPGIDADVPEIVIPEPPTPEEVQGIVEQTLCTVSPDLPACQQQPGG